MAAARDLREGIEIWVRCRVGRIYDPPNPALVTLTVGRRTLRASPDTLVYADDLDWQPAEQPQPAR
jgi:hypothetical protein